MDYMFKNMTSLIYLNIYSLEIHNDTVMDQSFNLLLDTLKICANEKSMQEYLTKHNKKYNCSDICFDQDIKLDIINDSCIKSCKENNYDYEFNYICYQQCPEGTHAIIKDDVSICFKKKIENTI